MMPRLDPELEVTKDNQTINTFSISCNLTCCKYSEDDIICFSELNFTDANNITTWAPWELAVRWTFTSLVVLVAVLGNLTIIIILAKNRLLLRTSVNHFILNMSVADLILALTGPIPFTIRDTSMFWTLGEVWCHLEGYIQMLVMLVSLASLATISCDRMMGVVRPFHTHLKTWQSLAIIVVIWVCSAVLAVPWGLYRVYTLIFPVEHPVMTHLKKRVVKMMFLVLLIFVVCWLPIQLLNFFYTSFLDSFGQFKDDGTKMRYSVLMTVAQYMIYVNPAVNPVIYGFLHQNFRRGFRLTFPCIFTRKSSLFLTRGQGLIRYMWSVKSTGSQPSVVVAAQRRHSVERQVQSSSLERNSATSRRLSGSNTLKDEIQKRNSHVSIEGERKKRKKFCNLNPGRLARQKSKKKESWSPENDKNEGFRFAHFSYINESYARDLPQRKISIISNRVLGHLVTEVIKEETSSDAERERVL